MGKVVKTVLKVAAVAAIAYFAPPLAAKIGASVGISSALGTTAISTALGAGAGELAGVGWQSGALVGGLAGTGQTGLFGGKPPTVGTGTTAPPAADTAFLEQATGGPLGPTGAGAAGVGGVAGAAPAAAAAAPTTIGGALSSAAQNPTNVLKGGLQNVSAGVGGALGAVGLGGLATSGTLGAVAPQLLAAGLVGNPGGALAKAQQAELERAQQVNAALTQQRLDQANQLFNEAAYYDPEYMARQAAEAAMIKGGIETAKQTRGLTGERLAAERRRMALGTSRSAGTAYQQGYGTGVGARAESRRSGISAMPTEYPSSVDAYGTALTGMTNQQALKSAQARELSKLFGKALNVPVDETTEEKPKSLTLNIG